MYVNYFPVKVEKQNNKKTLLCFHFFKYVFSSDLLIDLLMFKEISKCLLIWGRNKKSDFKFFFNKIDKASLLFPETALTKMNFPNSKMRACKNRKPSLFGHR